MDLIDLYIPQKDRKGLIFIECVWIILCSIFTNTIGLSDTE